MGTRYYDPMSGSFLSADPLGHGASLSLYDYCGGDPINGLDPDGRCPEKLERLVPGDAAWQQSMSSYNSGDYGEATLSFGAMIGEQALTVATFGMGSVGAVGVETASSVVVETIAAGEATAEIQGARTIPSKMTTVLGSSRDVSAYAGKANFNVLDMSAVPETEWARTNAEWLNTALRRGDNIWLVTDPIKHARLMNELDLHSFYLNLELPMLNEFKVIPKKVLYQ